MDRPIANPGTLLTAPVRRSSPVLPQDAPRGIAPGLAGLSQGLEDTGHQVEGMQIRADNLKMQLAQIGVVDARFHLNSLGASIPLRAQAAAEAAGQNWSELNASQREGHIRTAQAGVSADWVDYQQNKNPDAARIGGEEVNSVISAHTLPLIEQGISIGDQQRAAQRKTDVAIQIKQVADSMPAAQEPKSWGTVKSYYESNLAIASKLPFAYASQKLDIVDGMRSALLGSLKAGAAMATDATYDPATRKGSFDDVVNDAINRHYISAVEGQDLKDTAWNKAIEHHVTNGEAIKAQIDSSLRQIRATGSPPDPANFDMLVKSMDQKSIGFNFKLTPSAEQHLQNVASVYGAAIVGSANQARSAQPLILDPMNVSGDFMAADKQFRIDFNPSDPTTTRKNLIRWGEVRGMFKQYPDMLPAIQAMSDADVEKTAHELIQVQDVRVQRFHESPQALVEPLLENERRWAAQGHDDRGRPYTSKDLTAASVGVQKSMGVPDAAINSLDLAQSSAANQAFASGDPTKSWKAAYDIVTNPQNAGTVESWIKSLSVNPHLNPEYATAIQVAAFQAVTDRSFGRHYQSIDSVSGMPKMVEAQRPEVVAANTNAMTARKGLDANYEAATTALWSDKSTASMNGILNAANNDPTYPPQFSANLRKVIDNYLLDQMYGKDHAPDWQTAVNNTKAAIFASMVPIPTGPLGSGLYSLANTGNAMKQWPLQFRFDGSYKSVENWQRAQGWIHSAVFQDESRDKTPEPGLVTDVMFGKSTMSDFIFSQKWIAQKALARNFNINTTAFGATDSEGINTGQFGVLGSLGGDQLTGTKGVMFGDVFGFINGLETFFLGGNEVHPASAIPLPAGMQFKFSTHQFRGSDGKLHSMAEATDPLHQQVNVAAGGGMITPPQTSEYRPPWANDKSKIISTWAGANTSDPERRVRNAEANSARWKRNATNDGWELWVESAPSPGVDALGGTSTNRNGLLQIFDENGRPVQILDSVAGQYYDSLRQHVQGVPGRVLSKSTKDLVHWALGSDK